MISHRLSIAIDGSTFKIYVNGHLAGTGTGSLGPANTEPLRIGASGACGALWQGLIDEVEIYNRALSDSEVWAIFAAGSVGKCKPASVDGASVANAH